MDANRLRQQIAFSSGEGLNKILAQLQIDQAERDEQRLKRERRQAKWQILQVIGTIVALIALVASFISIRQAQSAATTQDQNSRFSSISQLLLDVDKTIADHPRLTSCFWHAHCNAKPKLTTKEVNQAKALAVYLVDYYSYLYDQFLNLGLPNVPTSGKFVLRRNERPEDNENWVTWSETIVAGFRSAMVCGALKKWVGEYEDMFVHAVVTTRVCPGLIDPYRIRPQ